MPYVEYGITLSLLFITHDDYAGFKLPDKTRNILLSVGEAGKPVLIESARRLQAGGYNLFATEGTKR